MKYKTKETLKKVAKWTGITLVTSAIVAGTGHHFGLWSIQPVYDFIGWNPAELNWAAYGSAIAYFGGKAIIDAIDRRRSYTQALNTTNLERKLESERDLMIRLDRQYEAELQTQAYLKAIIDNEIQKSEILANMEIAPASIKELAVDLKDTLKSDSLEILDDAANTLMDKGLNIAETFISNQLKKL